MRLALVHQGGGAKGAFGAGAILRLHEAGFGYDHLLGTSIGAANTAGLAVRGAPWLETMWHSKDAITQQQAFHKYSVPRVATRVLSGATSIYDFSPFYKLLLKELGPGPYPNASCGMVNLHSGRHFCVPSTARTVYASGSMPIFAAPVDNQWVDGGVRHMTPLAEAIDCGADAIVVILCTPRGDMQEAAPPQNLIDVIQRFIDITFNQIATADVQSVIEKNHLVKLALAGGQVPLSPSGKPYRYIPIMVIEPPGWLGGTLDFEKRLLERRFQIGYDAASRVLGPDGTFTETEQTLKLAA